MIDLEVIGIRLTEDSPILLLREQGGTRLLPIWLAPVDAAAIAVVLDEQSVFHRPMTHDLLAAVLTELGDGGRARITEVNDGVFMAVLEAGDHAFDCRPSDAVSVALRLDWPIECPEQLMDQVGVETEEDDVDEVDKFREFLDSVNPDDFETDDPSSSA